MTVIYTYICEVTKDGIRFVEKIPVDRRRMLNVDKFWFSYGDGSGKIIWKEVSRINVSKEDEAFYKEWKNKKGWVKITIDSLNIDVNNSKYGEKDWGGDLRFKSLPKIESVEDDKTVKIKVSEVELPSDALLASQGLHLDLESTSKSSKRHGHPVFDTKVLSDWVHIYPSKEERDEALNYLKAGEEYEVNLNDLMVQTDGPQGWRKHKILVQQPNKPKVIWKVGDTRERPQQKLNEEQPQTPNETPSESPKTPKFADEETLAKARKQTREAINEAFNQDPIVFNEELSVNNQDWNERLKFFTVEGAINETKDKVLAEIEKIREAKKSGKRKRDDEDQEPNKKPKIDSEDEEIYQNFLKSGISKDIEDKKLKAGLALAIRMEGDEAYNDEAKRKAIEEALWEINPQLCRETIIAALKERLKDNNINIDELDGEVKKLLDGEITKKEQVEGVKEQAIKEIGQKGAASKWSSLFSRAKTFLTEAKKNITEKIKKDIKTIQEQIKGFQSGNNSYLASFYEANKDQVEKLEKDISAVLNENQTGSEPKGTPWGVIISVSLAAVLVVAVAVVLVRRKRKDNEEREEEF